MSLVEGYYQMIKKSKWREVVNLLNEGDYEKKSVNNNLL